MRYVWVVLNIYDGHFWIFRQYEDMENTIEKGSIKMGVRNQITIPFRIAKKLNLRKGALLEITEESGQIIINPQIAISREDAWFWSREWQTKEREADEDKRHGRLRGPYRTKSQLQKILDGLKKRQMPRIFLQSSFENDYAKLPREIQSEADKALVFLIGNPKHPSLRMKKMNGTKDIWEIRISGKYRATMQFEGGICYLRRVGSHDILKKP